MMTELDEEKRFYERFYALHRDPVLRRVYECFGIGVFRRSSVLEGFDAFVRAVGFNGRRCVEIGTRNGLTAILLARYFEEVVSIDIEPNRKKHEIAEYVGVENVRFIDVADNEEKARVIGAMEFDAAYCDGDHARDTLTDFALVERCGRVLFDEYWETQQPVWQLVNQLRSRGTVEVAGKLAQWTAS